MCTTSDTTGEPLIFKVQIFFFMGKFEIAKTRCPYNKTLLVTIKKLKNELMLSLKGSFVLLQVQHDLSLDFTHGSVMSGFEM